MRRYRSDEKLKARRTYRHRRVTARRVRMVRAQPEVQEPRFPRHRQRVQATARYCRHAFVYVTGNPVVGPRYLNLRDDRTGLLSTREAPSRAAFAAAEQQRAGEVDASWIMSTSVCGIGASARGIALPRAVFVLAHVDFQSNPRVSPWPSAWCVSICARRTFELCAPS
jgi:hypothetical protein